MRCHFYFLQGRLNLAVNDGKEMAAVTVKFFAMKLFIAKIKKSYNQILCGQSITSESELEM